MEMMTRAGQRSLRDHNLCLVFSSIASADPDRPHSRADIAEATGLTKATVSSLVTTLRDIGLVTELEPSLPHRVGRPAIPLVVARGTVAAIGLEINVDFLGLRAIDLTGEVLDESFEKVNLRQSDPAKAFAALIRHAHALISRLETRSVRLVGACLALPGIADHPYGPLRLAPNLGWSELDIAEIMKSAYEALVAEVGTSPTMDVIRTLLVEGLLVDNEANLAARTEIDRHRDKSFIYVSGEIGIGAAIVVEGKVFSGLHGWAGEIGHVVVDPNGPTCACGATGCLEMYAGKRSLMLAAGLDPEDTMEDLLAAHTRGDPGARAAIDRAAEALGIALSDCINVVDVSRVVLGGSFAPLAGILKQGLASQISTRVLSSRWVSDLEIRPSDAGEYAAATGSALAVLDQAVHDPSSPLWGR